MNKLGRLDLTVLPALLVILAMLVACGGSDAPTSPSVDSTPDSTLTFAPSFVLVPTPTAAPERTPTADETPTVTVAESTPAAAGSAPDGTNATEATDWDTTNNFSLGNGDEHLENFHTEQCAQVTFHVTASGPVQVYYQDPSGKDASGQPRQTYWDVEVWEEGVSGELRATITPLGSGYGYLAVGYWSDHPATAKGTISYRVDPPASGTTCPTAE